MKHVIFLGLGSNLGDKESNINAALQQINLRVGNVVQRSSFYYSQPQGFESLNGFVNVVVRVETELEPLPLLTETQSIEQAMGRQEKSYYNKELGKFVYQDRIIDIDILLFDNLTINTPELQIPHPHMEEREFVMIPLHEVCFDSPT